MKIVLLLLSLIILYFNFSKFCILTLVNYKRLLDSLVFFLRIMKFNLLLLIFELNYQITQLSSIQSNTKGKTMLHFLVDYVARERKGLCQNMDGFTDMLGSMHDASKGNELHKTLLKKYITRLLKWNFSLYQLLGNLKIIKKYTSQVKVSVIAFKIQIL